MTVYRCNEENKYDQIDECAPKNEIDNFIDSITLGTHNI